MTFSKALSITALATSVAFAASAAHAGQCPPGQSGSDTRTTGAKAHKDVTDKVIGSIDLANEAPGLKGHKFRLRRLVVQPGGEVAWHSHADRPAIIYIVSGTILEYASTCRVPITHKAGDVATETHTTSHWWKNRSSKPVVLLSADILHDKTDPHTM